LANDFPQVEVESNSTLWEKAEKRTIPDRSPDYRDGWLKVQIKP